MRNFFTGKPVFRLNSKFASAGWVVLCFLAAIVSFALQAPALLAVIALSVGLAPAVIHLIAGSDDAREAAEIWVVFAWIAVGLSAVLFSGGIMSPLVIMLALGPLHALAVGRFRLGLEASVFSAIAYLALILSESVGMPLSSLNILRIMTAPIAAISVVQVGLYATTMGEVLAERRGQQRQLDLWFSTLAGTPVLILNIDRNQRVRSWMGDIDLLVDVTPKQLGRAKLDDLFSNADDFLREFENGVRPEFRGEAEEVCDTSFQRTRDGYRFVITPRRVPTVAELSLTSDGSNAAVWVASLGHELKNMINPVGGYSDLLLAERAGPLSEPYKEFAKNIKQGAEHLGHLVDDLMMAAKTRTGKLKLAPETLDAVGEAEDVLQLLGWQADVHGVELNLADDSGDFWVNADRKALRQILINLISNAIKYSKQGDPVEISVSESDVFVTFGVRDRGEGMPPEEVARLGEPFFQGENAKSRAGTGLGLSIVRLLAEEMQGHVTFESEVGQGTNAMLYLPKAEPMALDTEQAAE